MSAVLVFSSCSDFLEETAYSKFSKEEAYNNPTLVYLNSVASLYSALGRQGLCYDCDSNGENFHYLSEFSSDLCFNQGRRGDWVDGGAHQQIFLQTWDKAHSNINKAWSFQYKVIGLCNNSIDDIQSMLDAGGEAFLQNYINEIRAIRAYIYMQSLGMFGRVPIVTSSSMSVADATQSSRSEVYAFVRDELAEIIPTLSDASGTSLSSEYYGRMTKAAGYAMMAKLAANAAVWSQDTWNDGKFVGGVEKVGPVVTELGKKQNITLDGATRNAWETVIYCQEKLAKMGYKLNPDDHANFTTGNENSVENIFIRPNDVATYKLQQRLTGYTLHSNHILALVNGRGANGPAATVYCAELFGVTYDAATDITDYSKADPRWDMFFYYGDIYVNGKPVSLSSDYKNTLSYLPFAAKNDHGSPLAGSKEEYEMLCAGARQKKAECDKNNDYFKGMTHYQDADMVVYRYADILLLAAEAKYRLGYETTALEYVNQVRDRVKATPRTEITLKTILDERGLELVWEPVRRDDLIRYGMYTEPTTDKYLGCSAATGAGAWSYDAQGYKLVFPIPVSVLELNTKLSQNPGY